MKAKYFDGKTARSFAVNVRIQNQELLIYAQESDELLAQWPISGLKKDIREIRELVLLNPVLPGAKLELLPSKEVDEFALEYGYRPEFSFQFWRKSMVMVIVAIVGIVSVFYYFLPQISSGMAGFVSRKHERALENLVRKQVELQILEIQKPLQEKLAAIAETFAERDGEFQVEVLDWPEPNAFVAFGERIYFTKGLICQAQEPSQIIGILAHEVGHVEHRHVLKQVMRSLSLIILIQVGLGDFSQALIIDPETALTLLQRSHSREDEHQADLFAVEAMQRQGQDLSGLIEFFSRSRDLGALQFLSTHPPSDERTKIFEEAKKESGPVKEPLFSKQDLEDLKVLCLL